MILRVFRQFIVIIIFVNKIIGALINVCEKLCAPIINIGMKVYLISFAYKTSVLINVGGRRGGAQNYLYSFRVHLLVGSPISYRPVRERGGGIHMLGY